MYTRALRFKNKSIIEVHFINLGYEKIQHGCKESEHIYLYDVYQKENGNSYVKIVSKDSLLSLSVTVSKNTSFASTYVKPATFETGYIPLYQCITTKYNYNQKSLWLRTDINKEFPHKVIQNELSNHEIMELEFLLKEQK